MSVKRILIVDDALELGRMLRAAVETLGAGLEVKLFPSAEEALMETAHLPLDLLIADIRLPGITGLDLARRLRERSSDIKILLITGLTAKDLDAKAGAAGADRFLRKPFLMSEFMAAASELLGLRQPESTQSQTGPAAEEPPDPAIDLSGVLQRVRKGLGAALVLLADERGKVVAQTGERTDFEFEKQWAPAVLAALSAAQKASRLVNSGIPQGALVLRGNEQQLILAPVGDYAFVIVLGPDARMLRSALALEEALTAQAQLVRILDGMGVDFHGVTAISVPPAEVTPPSAAKAPVKSPAVVKPAAGRDIPSKPLHKAAKPAAEKKPEPSAEPVEAPPPVDKPVGPFTDYSEAALEGLGELLEKSEQALDPQKADEFWEQGLADMTGAVESPDGLTYDQAHQLGLTPDPN
ncbi:MAG: response regulator [Bellilinea sp.]